MISWLNVWSLSILFIGKTPFRNPYRQKDHNGIQIFFCWFIFIDHWNGPHALIMAEVFMTDAGHWKLLNGTSRQEPGPAGPGICRRPHGPEVWTPRGRSWPCTPACSEPGAGVVGEQEEPLEQCRPQMVYHIHIKGVVDRW